MIFHKDGGGTARTKSCAMKLGNKKLVLSWRTFVVFVLTLVSWMALVNVFTSTSYLSRRQRTWCPETSTAFQFPMIPTATLSSGSMRDVDTVKTLSSISPSTDYWVRDKLPDSFATTTSPSLKRNANDNNNENVIEVVVGVLSGRGDKYFERRQAIRNLWLNELSQQDIISIATKSGNETAKFRVLPVFFVGVDFCHIPIPQRTYPYKCDINANKPSIANAVRDHIKTEQRVTDALHNESQTYGDMVLVHVQDFFHNTPYKVATFFGWVLNSTNAQYVMKIDDDVFLDWRLLLQRLLQQQQQQITGGNSKTNSEYYNNPNQMWWWGFLRVNMAVVHDPSVHWGISKTDYAANIWSPYMSGGANMLNRNALQYIVQNYNNYLTHELFEEDVALGTWLSSTNIQYAHDNETFQRHPSQELCRVDTTTTTYATMFLEFCYPKIMDRIKSYKETTTGASTFKVLQKKPINGDIWKSPYKLGRSAFWGTKPIRLSPSTQKVNGMNCDSLDQDCSIQNSAELSRLQSKNSARIGSAGGMYTSNTQPASCGIYYFYHVGKCGGTSVREWQRSFANPLDKSFFHFDWYHVSDGSPNEEWKFGYQQIESIVYNNMTRTVKDLAASTKFGNNSSTRQQPLKWLSIHHHHQTPGLRYLMPKFRRWKDHLRSIGCNLIMTTVLREPYSRAKSLVAYNQIPHDSFEHYATTFFEGQARYLLFNSCKANPKRSRQNGTETISSVLDDGDDPPPPEFCAGPGITKFYLQSTTRNKRLVREKSELLSNATREIVKEEGEVEEVVEYLKEFDVVGRTEDLDSFIYQSEYLTGWNKIKNRIAKTKPPQRGVVVKGSKGRGPGQKSKIPATAIDGAKKAPHRNKSHLKYNITPAMKDILMESLETDYILWNSIFPSNET